MRLLLDPHFFSHHIICHIDVIIDVSDFFLSPLLDTHSSRAGSLQVFYILVSLELGTTSIYFSKGSDRNALFKLKKKKNESLPC